MECKMCSRQVSPLMGSESVEKELCQNCLKIKEMESSGALAKNGLMTTDLM